MIFKVAFVFYLLTLLASLFILIGWVMNLIFVLNYGVVWPPTGMVLVRIIGIVVFPIGGILGWF